MRSKLAVLLAGLVLFWMLVPQVIAEEGMWMLDQLNVLPFDQMKAKGLELTAEQIYNLKDAVVQIDGGSGAFVSPNGLILTNHHVAFGAIQQGSTLEQNFIQNGFLAKTLKDEIRAPGYQVLITEDFKDVTKEALKGVSDKLSPLDRYKAIEKNQKKLIAACEKGGKARCSVVEVLSGTKYYLFTYDRIKDVRLVYAPPSSIGSFGGDIDNWMWPRHAGDFSFFRAYVGPDGNPAEYNEKNVPYHPKKYLPISLKGYKEGSYTMIMGYPGNTFRYRDSYSIEMWQNHLYPFQIESAKEVLKLLNAKSEESPELAIKFADKIAGYSNTLKNNEGMLEGLKKTHLLDRKLKQEAEFKQFLAQNPDLEKKYGEVLPAIGKVYADLKTYSDKQNVLDGQPSDLLGFAFTIQKWSTEKAKKDMDREPQYQDRNIPDLKDYLKEAQHDLDLPTDQLLLEMFLTRAS
ncbi:MAG TPA: S46 family peptidase, partial [Terriglobales bacterium]|nr:S46 family peptidase [Terriglobales bacterium]